MGLQDWTSTQWWTVRGTDRLDTNSGQRECSFFNNRGGGGFGGGKNFSTPLGGGGKKMSPLLSEKARALL